MTKNRKGLSSRQILVTVVNTKIREFVCHSIENRLDRLLCMQ